MTVYRRKERFVSKFKLFGVKNPENNNISSEIIYVFITYESLMYSSQSWRYATNNRYTSKNGCW